MGTAIGVIPTIVIAVIIFAAVNTILAFSDGPGICTPGGGPITVNADNAAMFDRKWDELDATRIPDARLALLEGESGAPVLGDTEPVLEAIDEFLGEEAAAGVKPLAKEAVHTILFTDVEGSTALTQRLGDAKARELSILSIR